MPIEHEGQEQPKQAYDSEQYVMWGFSAHHERLTIGRNLETPDGEQLKALVLGLMNDWHPDLRQLVSSADPTTITAFPVKTSVPIRPWRTGRVTLLGDALHNMTPFRGVGANTALRDSAALRQTQVTVDRGDKSLIPALAAYERAMIGYGFQAVRISLKEMHRRHSESALKRVLTKAVFRAMNLAPSFKQMLQIRQ
jgi:2-polyprenyl-6-methoxyphenol hydroxylase-like FAD-dependent oxidoreductase